MARGRPIKSEVRQNIVELLHFMKKGYGYDIARNYNKIFPKVTMRLVYYHLKKGVEIGTFKMDGIEKEKGNYSWGEEVEKKYYTLGEKAEPKILQRIKDYFENSLLKE